MISFFAKIDFMSKFLDSCRKKWHQFGKNKDCHKILRDISNNWALNKTNQSTVQDIYSKASMLSLPVRKPKIPQTQKIVYENWLETYSINLTLVNQSYSYIACSGISDQIHGGYFQLIGHMTSPVPSQGSIPRCQLQKLPDRKNARNMSVYPNQNLHWKLGR